MKYVYPCAWRLILVPDTVQSLICLFHDLMYGWQHSTPKAFVEHHAETFHGVSSVDLVESQRQGMACRCAVSSSRCGGLQAEWKVFATDNHLKASESVLFSQDPGLQVHIRVPYFQPARSGWSRLPQLASPCWRYRGRNDRARSQTQVDLTTHKHHSISLPTLI